MRRPLIALAALALFALALAIGVRGPEFGEEDAPAAEAGPPAKKWTESPLERAFVPAEQGGEADAPHLLAGVSGGCGGSDGGPVKSLRSLLRRQGPDGGWGELPEEFEGQLYTRNGATALALLSFLGAGYTPLSREESDGMPIGAGMKRGLDWLVAHPPANALDAALTALALSETAGLMGGEARVQSALEALVRLDAFQRSDGCWGDPFTDFCGALALVSARAGSIPASPAMFDRASAGLHDRLASAPDLPSVTAAMFLDRNRDPEGFAMVEADLLAALPDPEHPEFSRDWMAALLLFRRDGPAGESWKTWNLPLKDALIPTQNRDGTWPGEHGPTASVVRDALAVLVLEVYYSYENVPGVREKE